MYSTVSSVQYTIFIYVQHVQYIQVRVRIEKKVSKEIFFW